MCFHSTVNAVAGNVKGAFQRLKSVPFVKREAVRDANLVFLVERHEACYLPPADACVRACLVRLHIDEVYVYITVLLRHSQERMWLCPRPPH